VLSDQERAELTVSARSRSLPASDVQRARVILLLAEGNSYRVVADQLGCSQTTVGLWRRRFLEEGLEGLYGRHHGSRKSSESQRLEAKILALTQKKPADGSTHWSTRKLTQVLEVSHMRVARVWSRAGLKPHRLDRYVASNDPDFETKAADVIGLYVNPPQHAAIFSVDEKSAIQALDRTLPALPLSPGRAERHGFEYIRRGTLSLYAALDTRTGQVIGKTVLSHTSRSSWHSWAPWWRAARGKKRSTSSPTTSRHTRRRGSRSSCIFTPTSSSISRRPTRVGLTRSSFG
jgi:transposase